MSRRCTECDEMQGDTPETRHVHFKKEIAGEWKLKNGSKESREAFEKLEDAFLEPLRKLIESELDKEATRIIGASRVGKSDHTLDALAYMMGGCPPPGAQGQMGTSGGSWPTPAAAACIKVPNTPAGVDAFREALRDLPEGLKAAIYRDLYREGMRIESAERNAEMYLRELKKKESQP